MIEVVTVEEFTTVTKQTKLVMNGYTDTIIILILVYEATVVLYVCCSVRLHACMLYTVVLFYYVIYDCCSCIHLYQIPLS